MSDQYDRTLKKQLDAMGNAQILERSTKASHCRRAKHWRRQEFKWNIRNAIEMANAMEADGLFPPSKPQITCE